MSPRERVILALMCLALAVTGVQYGVLQPYRAKCDAVREESAQLAQTLARYRQRVAAREAITQALMAARDHQRDTDVLFVPSLKRGAALSANFLRGQIELTAQDIKITANERSRNAKDPRIGFTVEMECTTAELAEFLKRAENAKTLLTIQYINIIRKVPPAVPHQPARPRQPAPEPVREKDPEPARLKVSMHIFGHLPEDDA